MAVVGAQVLAVTQAPLIRIPLLTPPSYLSFLNPTVHQSLATFLGVPMRGNWAFFTIFSALVVVQVLAEECWWRGYIFPRQERTYGRSAWLVHGTMWAGFHCIFYPWSVVVDLFFCNVLAFVVHRTGSTWSGLVLHMLYNSLTPVLLLLLVLGVVH